MAERVSQNSRFLRACRREPVDATPVWLMRQAGRYMPEYRALRERYDILEIIKTPELACEVTLQPMNAFDLDAAIIFADILTVLEGMGLQLSFEKGEGPVIHNPVRSLADVEQLRTPAPEDALDFTMKAIRLARKELDARELPLIGFSGGPYTLACYAVEGGSSRSHRRVKQLMMSEPEIWHQLMTKLSEVSGEYLLAQAQAGAQALQLFDSWAGELNIEDYRKSVLPYSRRAIEIAQTSGVPVIHFAVNNGHLLEAMRAAGGDVIGVDWRVNLDAAWNRLGNNWAVQGNLDPVSLFCDWETLERRTRDVLDEAAGRVGHIFNLGHGILPETPVENVRRLVDFVHQVTSENEAQSSAC